jgi:phage terminase large subunit
MLPNPHQWAPYVFDLVAFVENIIGATPDRGQIGPMKSIQDPLGKFRTAIKSCHGAGKTTLLAWILLWFMCTRYFAKVAVTAPTEHQLDDKLWPEVYKWASQSKAGLLSYFEWEKKRFFLKSQHQRWFAVPRVAKVEKGHGGIEEAMGMQGFHEKHFMFLGDEASGIPDAIYGTMQGAVSTCGEMKLVVGGNPNITSGFFYDAFNKQKDLWNTHTISYLDTDLVDNDWALEMIETYGVDHPWVQVKVFGNFPTKMAMGLYDFGAMVQAAELVLARLGKKSLGVDVARSGDAKSVITMMSGPVVDFVNKYRNMKAEELAVEIEYIANSEKCDYVVIDADGMGAAVFDIVEKLLADTDIEVIGWRGGLDAVESHRFANCRAELNWKLAEHIVKGKIQLTDDEDTRRQAAAYTYDFSGKGKILVPEKKKIAKAIGESPDELDSLGYAAVPYIYGDVAEIPREQNVQSKSLIM